MNIQCRLASIAPANRRNRHGSRCLRCQAAAVRARGLARELQDLRDLVVPAPPGLAPAVIGRLGPQDSFAPRRTLVLQRLARHTAAAGVAAATAIAVATGVVRWKSRPLG
jgi:hypothetical protein